MITTSMILALLFGLFNTFLYQDIYNQLIPFYWSGWIALGFWEIYGLSFLLGVVGHAMGTTNFKDLMKTKTKEKTFEESIKKFIANILLVFIMWVISEIIVAIIK